MKGSTTRKKETSKFNNKKDFQKFVAKLESMILTGGFKPRERLVEASLSRMFGVSRYWVRDAFKILETKELVTITPFKGVSVSELNEKEVEEIFVIRVALEQLAWRLSMEKATREDIKTLKRLVEKVEKAHKQKDISGMVEADTNFHRYVFRLSGNRNLRRMINDLRNRCHLIRYSAWSSPDVLREIMAEHRQLVEAMEKKDSDRLLELAEGHISHAKKLYVFQLKTGSALKF
ncbi:MAG: GntR family transcriptional regulator [Desulfobacteraceae bacterium]